VFYIKAVQKNHEMLCLVYFICRGLQVFENLVEQYLNATEMKCCEMVELL